MGLIYGFIVGPIANKEVEIKKEDKEAVVICLKEIEFDTSANL